MLADPATYLLLSIVGGLIAVDATGCGQFMISRPFVAASLAGLIVGDPAAGAAIGLVLEVFHLTVLPVGAARYPEGGPAAVAAGALYAGSAGGLPVLFTATVFFLGWSLLSGASVRLLRQLNIRLFAIDPGERLSARELERRHMAALALDFLRGTVLVAAGMAVLIGLLALSRLSWGIGDRVPALVLDASVAALLAGCLRFFAGRATIFAAGAAGGLILLLARS